MEVRAVFLVGFMGSGKSSVGQELARSLRWEFLDLDAQIESREGKTISEIFRQSGEAGFRRIETAALNTLTNSLRQNSVVALGGGAFVHEANRSLIHRWPSVFLDAPVDELWRRSSEEAAVRPLRQDLEQFSRLLADRLPFYRQATITVVTSGKDIAAICREIERTLSLGESRPADFPSQSDSASFECGGVK